LEKTGLSKKTFRAQRNLNGTHGEKFPQPSEEFSVKKIVFPRAKMDYQAPKENLSE